MTKCVSTISGIADIVETFLPSLPDFYGDPQKGQPDWIDQESPSYQGGVWGGCQKHLRHSRLFEPSNLDFCSSALSAQTKKKAELENPTRLEEAALAADVFDNHPKPLLERRGLYG